MIKAFRWWVWAKLHHVCTRHRTEKTFHCSWGDSSYVCEACHKDSLIWCAERERAHQRKIEEYKNS